MLPYLAKKVVSDPQQPSLYGYRWQPNKGMPPNLQTYVPAQEPGGIYVAFFGVDLADWNDPFGRIEPPRPGPVFTVPTTAPSAVLALVKSVKRNPPADQDWWDHLSTERLKDISAFLEYVATCLNLLYQTPTGKELLDKRKKYPCFIVPGRDRNVLKLNENALDRLTLALIEYELGAAIPAKAISDAVMQRWPNVAFVGLANAMTKAPLYSLFESAAGSQPPYLGQRFSYNGGPLTAELLRDWCTTPASQSALAFDARVRGSTLPGPDGVVMRDLFLLVLRTALGPDAPAGQGQATTIHFCVKDIGDNVSRSANFRPPAIGLAHELVCAMHAEAGTSPGLLQDANWACTATGLMVAGIGPSATNPVNENAIRRDWVNLAGPIDPSNAWPHPVERLVYFPPFGGKSVADMRAEFGCL